MDVLLELPAHILLIGAFAGGWLLTMLAGFVRRRLARRRCDPRDDRIRSLEAELRIARADRRKVEEKLDGLRKDLDAASNTIDDYARRLNDQGAEAERLRRDLRDSVRLTHELRGELTDRAEENLRSTVKLQQVETELSVVRESNQLISTGVLDYNVDDGDSDEDEPPQLVPNAS